GRIGVREIPALQERDAVGVEVAGRYRVERGVSLLLGDIGAAWDGYEVIPAAVAQRRDCHECRGLDLGHGFGSLQNAAPEFHRGGGLERQLARIEIDYRDTA